MKLNAKILEILNLKPNQSFQITGPMISPVVWTPDRVYYFDEDLILYYSEVGINEFSPSMHCQKILYDLLTDPAITIKPVVVPTKEESIAISYFKLAGYKYLAKDSDGRTYAYKGKPRKNAYEKLWEGPNYAFCVINMSFLSWKDEEPYYIGEQ